MTGNIGSGDRRPLHWPSPAFREAGLALVRLLLSQGNGGRKTGSGRIGFGVSIALLSAGLFPAAAVLAQTAPAGTLMVQMVVSDSLTENKTGNGTPGVLSASSTCTMSSTSINFGTVTLTAANTLPSTIRSSTGSVAASCTTGGAGGAGSILIQATGGHGNTTTGPLMTLNDVNGSQGVKYQVYSDSSYSTAISYGNLAVYTLINYSEFPPTGGKTIVSVRLYAEVKGSNLSGGLIAGTYKDTIKFALTY